MSGFTIGRFLRLYYSEGQKEMRKRIAGRRYYKHMVNTYLITVKQDTRVKA